MKAYYRIAIRKPQAPHLFDSYDCCKGCRNKLPKTPVPTDNDYGPDMRSADANVYQESMISGECELC